MAPQRSLGARLRSAVSSLSYWTLLAAVVWASAFIVRSITGSLEPTLLNFVLVVPVTAAVALLVIFVRDRVRASSW